MSDMNSSIDPNIMRLQFEILNRSAEDLARELNIPASIIKSTIESEGWKQWWPEGTVHEQFASAQAANNNDPDIAVSEEEILVAQADQFLDRSRKRLQVYSLAKEIYLAQKYMQVEVALLDKARSVIENSAELDAYSLKQISGLLKDLYTKAGGLTLSAGTDENGLPTAVIRDLSGR